MKNETLINCNDLAIQILNIAKENKYTSLLSKETVDKYYNTYLKKELQENFYRFKEALLEEKSYLYDGHLYNGIKSKTVNTDKILNCVESNIRDKIWLEAFYNVMLSTAKTISLEEAIYLVGTFLGNITQDEMSSNLKISRSTLNKIKKSCLVKMHLAFKDL